MHQPRNRRSAVAAVIVVALIGGMGYLAWAYTPGACYQDGERLCPGLKGKELTACLKTHEADLSMECKVNLAEGREMVRETKDACQPDIEKFCAGVKIGEGRVRRCLKAHEAELSSACKTQISAFRKKYQAPSTPAAQPPAVSSGTK